jgi:hypothetical protein
MADWVTISSLATAGGTLVLATATFASVRSANRSAKAAEMALQEQRRPVLVNSRDDDAAQAIGFADGRRTSVRGGGAWVDPMPNAVYLAISLRNVGAGIAVLQSWRGSPMPQADEGWRQSVIAGTEPPGVEDFRPLTRDQYIASGDVGVWQGVVRDAADPLHAELASAATEGRRFIVDLLYTDQVGGQRTISRFGVIPADDGWIAAAARHWYLDAPAPR